VHHASDRADLTEERRYGFAAIVSDLIALIAHVEASINPIEASDRRETSPADQAATNVIVLDDVTPQYIKATCALNTCCASLGTTLQFLVETARQGGHAVSLTQLTRARGRAAIRAFGIAK
jgi:hypothetical protein